VHFNEQKILFDIDVWKVAEQYLQDIVFKRCSGLIAPCRLLYEAAQGLEQNLYPLLVVPNKSPHQVQLRNAQTVLDLRQKMQRAEIIWLALIATAR
jgi:hypothetical protein